MIEAVYDLDDARKGLRYAESALSHAIGDAGFSEWPRAADALELVERAQGLLAAYPTMEKV